jgi:hypothetical protein
MEESADKSRRPAAGHVVLSATRRPRRLHDHEGAATAILRALGMIFTFLGIVEVLLLWIPPQFANAAWEFATLSRTLDGMPMVALGLALIAYSGVHGSAADYRWVRAHAMALGVTSILILALAAFYATVTPAVLANTPPEAMDAVRRAVIKTTFQLAAYFLLFGYIALSLWKRTRVSA